MVGNNKIFFSPSQSARNDQAENFPKLPKYFQAWGYFQSAQNVWAWMKNIFNIYKVPIIIGQNKKISKCPNFLSIRTFPECPIFLGGYEKFNVYNFPSHAKISK